MNTVTDQLRRVFCASFVDLRRILLPEHRQICFGGGTGFEHYGFSRRHRQGPASTRLYSDLGM